MSARRKRKRARHAGSYPNTLQSVSSARRRPVVQTRHWV